MAAKAHHVGHGNVDRRLAGLVWNVVQVTFRVRFMQINGGRNDARLDRHDRNDGFNRARRAHCMAGHGFGGTNRYAIGMFAEAGFNGNSLRLVIVRGRGAVGVDVVYLVGSQSRFLQGAAHGAHQAGTAGSRLRLVVGISRRAIANEFGKNVCAPGLCKLQVFQDQHGRTLAHHETVACGIERTAGSLRVIVAAREGVHVIESRHPNGHDGLFGTARDHGLCVSPADGLPGFADGVAAGGAG